MRRWMTSMGAILAMVATIAGPVSAAQRPIVLEFEKAWAAPDYYVGTVGGGGSIQMWLSNKAVIGNTQHFDAAVEVDAPSGDFTAFVSGQINFSTGRVALNGIVTSGWKAGARVHEESQLIDPAIGSFTGTIQIMPAS
jgi:hypothetical protein